MQEDGHQEELVLVVTVVVWWFLGFGNGSVSFSKRTCLRTVDDVVEDRLPSSARQWLGWWLGGSDTRSSSSMFCWRFFCGVFALCGDVLLLLDRLPQVLYAPALGLISPFW